MGKVKKSWLTNGAEDKFLHKLAEKGKITKDTKPNYLRDEYPDVFGRHSENVVRNHLNVFKRSNGSYRTYFSYYFVRLVKQLTKLQSMIMETEVIPIRIELL